MEICMKKILIVNRGEIAIRIGKSIKELGHIPVGLWTDYEVHASHLEYCEEWIRLEGKNNLETYLNIPQLVEIIKKYKIDAVHPGYGFLSENAKFANAVREAGAIFIGPNTKAIEVMGNKSISKIIAAENGVPTVPGSKNSVETVAEALIIAEQIGYPVLLKAVSGGGGKGMRTCATPEELNSNFEMVKRESLRAFNDDGVLVEKFIQNPHHIEVQILGHPNGNIYHLFERECSVQRRHQKIIEEAPSPFIGNDEMLREEICRTALKLARAVEYDSAGTVEFIMGEDRKFYFLEMNTRIQVEHPITEMITSVDLVSEMICAALGESFSFTQQNEIQKRGYAVECRICAEDSVTLLPTPGTLHSLELSFGPGVRFDHCLYNGLEVTPDFDPMVAKLIVIGNTRAVAMRKMRSALNCLQMEGLNSNIELHKIILSDPHFVEGNYSTTYMEKQTPHEKINPDIGLEQLYEKVAALEASLLN